MIEFFVPGIPAPGGSKRFVGFGKKTGRAILIDDAGARNKNWRAVVSTVALEAMAGREVITMGAIHVSFEFVMPRPKAHYLKSGALRASAPCWHTKVPDGLKLARSTEDAMTGIVYRDDSMIAREAIAKRFAAPGEATGCRIKITRL